MRPVNKGSWPIDPKTNAPKVFKDDRKKDDKTYKKAKPYLMSRLGHYCSYCETKLDISTSHVEHKLPKSLEKYYSLRGDWDNFLLACGPCNNAKSDKDIELDDVYWPEIDNTAWIFDYQFHKQKNGEEVVIIEVNSNLRKSQKEKAQRTLELTGLNRYPGGPDEPTPADERYEHRKEAWDKANQSLKLLQKLDDEEMRQDIVVQAKDKGFFSVWMTVFRDDPDMLKRFIDAFPGTAEECFDDRGRPLPTTRRQSQPTQPDSIPQQPPQYVEIEKEEDTPVVNPALTQKPRYQIADVIPLEYETSILDWLERSGRLMDRTSNDEDPVDPKEEMAELIENVKTYDDENEDDMMDDD